MRGKISVVIPAYKSRQSLPILIDRLETTLSGLGRPFEVVLVDDCSPDDTWEVMLALKQERRWLKIARLLRNSGQHNAILCGFSLVTGDVVVTMDDDLQNPPEEIPALLAAVDGGVDLAIGAYDDKKHASVRSIGGGLIDAVQRKIFGLPPEFQLTSFRAIRRAIVDNVSHMEGVYPYVTSMLLSHTSKCANVSVRHEARAFGESNYNLKRSVLLALNLLLTYSSYPLYFLAALCFGAFAFSGAFGVWILWRALAHSFDVPGWATTVVLISLLNALILFALVVQGIYISRLSRTVSRSLVSFTIGELHD